MDTKSKDIRIVIAQRGFVFVGEYSREGDDVRLTNAKNVRRWGTSKGLGELRAGPLKDTRLDEAGEVELHYLAVVATLKVDAEKWSSSLG